MSDPQERASLFEPPDDNGDDMPRKGNPLILIGLVVALLLVLLIGGGLVAAMVFGNQLGSAIQGAVEHRESNIPTLLSEDTQVYGSITPALGDVPNVARLQAAFPEAFVAENPETANDQLAEIGLNFEEDIQPWLGPEVGFAVSGLDDIEALMELSEQSPSPDSIPPGMLSEQVGMTILASSTNDEAAQAFLAKLRTNLEEQEGMEFAESEYNGVTIYEQTVTTEEEIPLVFALAKGTVMFSNQLAAIQAIVDREENAEDSLANNERYQQLREAQPDNAIGFIYIDGQMFGDLMDQALEQEETGDLPPAQLERLEEQMQSLQAFQSMGFSIAIEPEGLAFDVVAIANVEEFDERTASTVEASSVPVAATRLENISGEALALITARIPDNFGEEFMRSFEEAGGGDEMIAEINQQMGIDLEQDFLDWFHGEISLVILPGQQFGDVSSPATGYFAIQPGDREAAESGIENIASAIEMQMGGFLVFETTSVANTDWQAIADPSTGEVAAGYGFVEDDLVIAFGTNAMEAAVTGSEDPITTNERFSAVMSSLPEPNTGVFYIDITDTITVIDEAGVGTTPPEVEEAQERIEPLQAAGASAEPGFNDEGVAHTRLFVYIAPVEGEGSGEDSESE